jgi:hypothetical protein
MYESFYDIPQYTKSSRYECDVAWQYLENQLNTFQESYDGGLELCPDFQRGHVWTDNQQIAYIEFNLRGGTSGRDIYFNATDFDGFTSSIQLVDGLQRLTAVRKFLANEIPAFGQLRNEYKGRLDPVRFRFRVHVNDLPTRADVLKWYLEMNSGGTPHSEDELNRVSMLWMNEVRKLNGN